ncbi:MAG: nickel pincer cofactor biosynthesis protein LarC [Chloroflexota bacterium]
MKIAYFDCIAGASGDMILGALLDCGLSETALRKHLNLLRLPDFDLDIRRVEKLGFSAIKVDVNVKDDVPVRHLPEIEAIVQASELSNNIKQKAIDLFHTLGQVEAKIHHKPLDQVHLHELGGVDTIVDVVGVLGGLEMMGIDQVVVSPLPMGRGFVRGAHGKIPLPAPATIALLKGVPITGSDIDMELVTPTGAVLLTALATSFGKIPSMTLSEVGYGAGGRDLEIPNVLRVLVGHQESDGATKTETLTLLETNIDDLNPEFYDHVMTRLFATKALDVFMTPLHMKKNRPGTKLQVLCHLTDRDALKHILFTETSTLGIREQTITRHRLERVIKTIDTRYGAIKVKVALLPNGQAKIAPEYEDCRQAASTHNVPIRDVYLAAQQAAM